MRRTLSRWLAGVAALVLFAACSGGGSSDGVPTANGAADTATTQPNSGDQALIDYVHCMRARGVTIDDPAPRPGHSGLSLNVPDLSVPGVSQADGQCKHFLAPVIAAKGAGAHDRLTPSTMRGLLAYARCMRSHDIALLDPDPSDGHLSLGNVTGINNSVGRQDPQFHDADAACRHLLPMGIPDDGTGPP